MSTEKIAITIDKSQIQKLDALVMRGVFPNRSKAIQAAVADKLAGLGQSRLALACSLLEASEEQKIADEIFANEPSAEW